MYDSHSYASKLTQESSRCGRFWHHSGSFGRLGGGRECKIRTGARLSPSCPTLCTHTFAAAAAVGGGSPLFCFCPSVAVPGCPPYRPYSVAAAIYSTQRSSQRVSQSDLLGDREANENEERIQGRRTRTDGRCEWGRTV